MGITRNQFGNLEDLYNYYNQELFCGQLSSCMINLSRKNRTYGFFAPHTWGREDAKIHEISLNPDTLLKDDMEWHQTLVHEMCHLWQFDHGKYPRRGYHDKQWGQKMESVGLIPSSTGKPGGKKTGQKVADYPAEDGPFLKSFNAISEKDLMNLKIPYQTLRTLNPTKILIQVPLNLTAAEAELLFLGENLNGKKATYQCSCGFKVWGKPGLKLQCIECFQNYIRTK